MEGPHIDELLGDFEAEARERLERVEEMVLEARPPGADADGGRERLDEIRRELHTLKGNAGMMGLGKLQAEAHAMEDLLEAAAADGTGQLRTRPLLAALDRLRALIVAVRAPRAEAAAGGAGGTSAGVAAGAEGDTASGAPPGAVARGGAGEAGGGGVRVPFATLDELIDLLAEMVTARSRLGEALARTRPLRGAGAAGAAGEGREVWSEADEAHERLDGVLDVLQERVMQLRMVPLRSLFRQLGRIVHDTAEQERKVVRLVAEGGDTGLDKALLELAAEALGHLVRNAIVHGIEEPAERRRGGKDESGTLRLAAHATAREVIIDVEDDGRGVQIDAVRAAAARAGAALPGAGEAPGGESAAGEAGTAPARPAAAGADVLDLLFLPGLSTRAHADLGAGRGIGLAVVKRAVESRGGSIDVASVPGMGSLFRLRLPLSASIARALLLGSDGDQYALPLRAVLESLRLLPGDLHEINGGGALRWRGRVIPALDLGRAFGTAAHRRRHGYAVIVEERGRTRALVVDQVLDIREVVVKGLDRMMNALPGVAGSTVLGNGRAVLVLDPASLVAMSPLAEAAANAGAPP